MNKRDSYADLGMIIAIGVFICLLIKSLLFGFTWGCITGIIFSIAYFLVSWKYPSDSKIVKHSTTAFLVLSVLVAVSVVMFDKNARPKMHAFEGTGDTIQDVRIEESDILVPMYETLPEDTSTVDTVNVAVDSMATLIPEEGQVIEGADTTANNLLQQ